MKLNLRTNNIIFATLGAVVGALGGFFVAKAHYEKVYQEYADETIAEMKEILYGGSPENPDDPDIYDEEEEDSVNPVNSSPLPQDVRQKLERNREGTNYAAIYGQIHGGKKHEETHREDPEDTEDSDEAEDPEPEVARRHEANKGRKPHLISADRAAELPSGIDHVELQFYDEDGILADVDTEERIYDVERVVGDCLTKYGFVDSDEQVIYVMNEELDTCYEIMRVDASYEETHPE